MTPGASLNYHHLLYFHTTAREGSVTAAARRLRLAQPTLSAQIKQLEEALGAPLFDRQGRALVLTPVGRVVDRYAQEIFGLGAELVQAVRSGARPRLAVGVADTLPKLMVARLLEPALVDAPRLTVRDGDVPTLLAELADHRLDLVLSDAPIPAGAGLRAFNHALGDCGVSFFAAPALAASLRSDFPHNLDGAPLLAPGAGSALGRSLAEWLDAQGLTPDVVAEIDDSALLKTFGAAGRGIFVAPIVVEEEVMAQYHVQLVGRTEAVRERFWALSAERRIRHPAVAAVVEGAKRMLG